MPGIYMVGLTGGIGCGKTTVANLFASLGVPVADADVVARALVAPGLPAYQAILDHFGDAVRQENGELDRAALKTLIFARAAERHWLEGLLHPLVYRELEHWAARQVAPYALFVVPLLLETGRRDWVDRLLVVDCQPETQLRRVRQRDGDDAELIRRVMAAQSDRDDRLAAADDILVNDGEPGELLRQVELLHDRYLRLAAESAKSAAP
jgi:dephospho-CoA kinase